MMRKLILHACILATMTIIHASNTTNSQTVETIYHSINKHNIHFIDLDFTDLFGNLKTYTITTAMLKSALKDGICFDGSSVNGFSKLASSDLRLLPIPETFTVLPWTQGDRKTASLMCDMYDAKNTLYPLYPRTMLKKVCDEAHAMGYAFHISPEIEFFILKKNPLQKGVKKALTDCDGYCNPASNEEINLLKLDILNALTQMGFNPEKTHHEVASSQHEITMKYESALKVADRLLLVKKAMKYLAHLHGYYSTFMPKPLQGENGSGMHINYSLYDTVNNKNAFFNADGLCKLSREAQHFIAGNMKHIKAMTAVFNPTINSYKRLIPGYEAPVYISWGTRNRSGMIRIPNIAKGNEHAMRAELRCSDAMTNPYLAFGLLLASGLDGIKNTLQLQQPTSINLFEYSLSDVKEMGIKILPSSLEEALNYMANSTFINETLGDLLCKRYIEIKRQEVIDFKQSVSHWELEKYL